MVSAATDLDESRENLELNFHLSLEEVVPQAICSSEIFYLLSLVVALSLHPKFPGLDPACYQAAEANYWLEKEQIDDRECGSWQYLQKGRPGRSVDHKDRCVTQVLMKLALSTASVSGLCRLELVPSLSFSRYHFWVSLRPLAALVAC